jgi:CubicO group peptidase (beta-lactamase class C family)
MIRSNIIRLKLKNTIINMFLICLSIFSQFNLPSQAEEFKSNLNTDNNRVICQFESKVDNIFKKSSVPGIAVAVIKEDKIISIKCLGVRRNDSSEPITPDTVFQIASCSKPVTATVIASLAGEGKIKWDDPIIKYYHNFKLSDPWITEHVNFRDLLSHRSGLPPYSGDYLMGYFNYDISKIIHHLRYQKFTDEFRTKFAYQNILFETAAQAASKATGKDWPDLVEERIFKPLGMKNSSSRFSDYRKNKNKASSHRKIKGKITPTEPLNIDIISSAGGVSSSVNDMSRWLRMLLARGKFEGKQIIDPKAVNEMFRPNIFMGDSTEITISAYAIGWMVSSSHGKTVISHTGAFNDGISTIICLIPSENAGIVILTNEFPQGRIVTDSLVKVFRDMIIKGNCNEDYFKETKEKVESSLKKKTAFDSPDRLTQIPKVITSHLPLDSYTGIYKNDFFGIIRIEKRGNSLVSFLGNNTKPFKLNHWDGNVFAFDIHPDVPVIFNTRRNNSVDGVTMKLFDHDGVDGVFKKEEQNNSDKIH